MRCVEKIKAYGSFYDVAQGDVLNLPYEDGQVSFAISFGVIEHFEDGLEDAFHADTTIWLSTLGREIVGSELVFDCGKRVWIWFLQAMHKFRKYKVAAYLYDQIIRDSVGGGKEIVDFGTSPLNSL